MLIQSSAILESLEETVPEPPLLPSGPLARAKVRAVAAIIGCDIHPLNNAAVLNAPRRLGQDEAAVGAWVARWITAGLDAVEALIGEEGFGPARTRLNTPRHSQRMDRSVSVLCEPWTAGVSRQRRPSHRAGGSQTRSLVAALPIVRRTCGQINRQASVDKS